MRLKNLVSLLITLTLLLSACALAETAAIDPLDDIDAPASADDILKAMEVYSWFVMSPLEVDRGVISPDGTMYLIADETLRKTTDMQAMLDKYFSTDISQSLWAWNAYQDVDGQLYGYTREDSPYARSVDESISEIAFKVTEESYKKRVYTATLTDTDGNVSNYEYISEYLGGHWIFIEYPFIW